MSRIAHVGTWESPEPRGQLSRVVLDDLTADEADEFVSILDGA
jgi:hypothetical protein